MNVAVIGAGAWGTALAITAARGASDVVLWSYDGNCRSFPGVMMPNNISLTHDMAHLRGADIWLVVTPAAYFRDVLTNAREYYNNQPIIICTKGAERDSGLFMSEVLRAVLPQCDRYGVLSGPQFAAEVAAGIPTGSTLAAVADVCATGKSVLSQLYIECSDDIIGAEICGVGKNAVALICGYNSVMAAGENERALIVTRAWGEVVRIGQAIGAKTQTFLELCGIGDLFLSATSHTSRNFAGGAAIARGDTPEGTVEGIYALRALVSRADSVGVDVPVLRDMLVKLNI